MDQDSDGNLGPWGGPRRDPGELLDRLANQASEIPTQSRIVPLSQNSSEKTENTVRLGQVVADQVIRYQNCFNRAGDEIPNAIAVSSASEVVKAILPTSSQYRLDQFAKLMNPLKPAAPPKAARPASKMSRAGRDDLNEQELKLGMPQFRARRGTRVLDLSLYALRFWEELGLSPYGGQKDVTAFLICPETEMFHRGSVSFLDAIGSTYTSLRLGLHSSGNSTVKGQHKGVVSVPRSVEESNDAYEKFGG